MDLAREGLRQVPSPELDPLSPSHSEQLSSRRKLPPRPLSPVRSMDCKLSDYCADAKAGARGDAADAKQRGRLDRKAMGKDDDDSDAEDLTEEEDASSGDEGDGAFVNLAAIRAKLGQAATTHRRSVVSSVVPPDTQWTPPHFPKNAQDADSIRRSVRRNLLFTNIGDETLELLVNAMQYRAFSRGTQILAQGEPGDLFYILDSGNCEARIDGRVVGEIDGTSTRNFFGELALLYDAPRAATVSATTDVECWTLDRVTFKRVLMSTTIQQRRLHLDFVQQVPIFAPLSSYDKMIVADALRSTYFAAGDVIIEEGTSGDDFYIVEDGEVRCTKGNDEVSARLGSGDFFGELALLTDDMRMATVTAVRKTKCLVLDRKTFKRLLGPIQEHLRKRQDLYELYMPPR